MKGLLIKDFRLMLAQKRYFTMVTAIAVGMAVMQQDTSFVLGYMTFVLSQFAVSTISYDEFDNGYAFLFTLPVSRRLYAVEKYLFGLLLTGGACLLSTALAAIITALQGGALLQTLMNGAAMLPAVLMMQSLLLPFQMKYGGEKGRLAIFAVFGVVFAAIIGGGMLAEQFNLDLTGMLEGCIREAGTWLMPGLIAVTLLAEAISLRISVGIMEKKEF